MNTTPILSRLGLRQSRLGLRQRFLVWIIGFCADFLITDRDGFKNSNRLVFVLGLNNTVSNILITCDGDGYDAHLQEVTDRWKTAEEGLLKKNRRAARKGAK